MKGSLSTLLILLFLFPGCSRERNADELKPTIAVIPKGTTHVFWRSVEAGARKAEEEFDLNIVWKGPLKENDRAFQIALVEQFVTEGVDGIVLAPLDDTALLRPVRSASKQGVPVVIFDSGLKGDLGEDFVSFVATDNLAGGQIAGKEMVRLLEGEGKVVLLRFQVGSASTTLRETGFLQTLAEYPDIDLILENQYGGATSGETIQKSEELLDVLREADGIFCPNESTTYGMLVTLRKHHLTQGVKFIGFDASEEMVRGLREGDIDALIVQDPWMMGYRGVEVLFSHLKGEPVPPRINTGVQLVTRENIDDPEIANLLE